MANIEDDSIIDIFTTSILQTFYVVCCDIMERCGQLHF